MDKTANCLCYLKFLFLSDRNLRHKPIFLQENCFCTLTYCKFFVIKKIMLLDLKSSNGRLLSLTSQNYMLKVTLKDYSTVVLKNPATSKPLVYWRGRGCLKDEACHGYKHRLYASLQVWSLDPRLTMGKLGFPGGSAGKESACSAGDPSSIPGSGRSLEKG